MWSGFASVAQGTGPVDIPTPTPIAFSSGRFPDVTAGPTSSGDIIEPVEVIGLIVKHEELGKRREKLEKELDRAVDELKRMGAERIILIGSMAEGDIGPFSDIDLVVVMRTQERFLDRLKTAYGKIRPSVAMDILIYSPDELDDLRETSAFVIHALEKGRVLYAA
jgi:predicted nucleotidyltransferase